ncbi:ABC transporter ATP-binding protein [Actinoplanes sp. KI2]|uniref:ABC transporter ATP-binding protein n=1 Tax=Actinoplanes sp. KI2 TaxID=2983315 RepID=UPI00294FF733|nr:ABC transporter ATP-binding protein [Actinoplanes sp. KI2]
MSAATRFTRVELWRHRGAVARLAGWSLAEALPALFSGYATARAVDHGFLAGRPAVGLAWLGGYAGVAVVGALGSRGAYRCLSGVVEPFRDTLVARVVAGDLRRATAPGGRPDGAAVARLTHQVEVVRDTLAGLLTVVRGFVFGGAAALAGLALLAPALAALVAGPLAAGLVIFLGLLPAMAARQRRYVYADERLARTAGSMLRGHRDIAAARAHNWAVRTVGEPVDEQARAERALARMGALRRVSLAVGGWLPLVALLAGASWAVRHGAGPGAVLGAVVYARQGLQPALNMLVQGLAGGGLRYGVTLSRMLAATADPAIPAVRREPPAPPGVLRMRGVTFRYGPAAEPVLDRFDLDVDEGEHLAVVGASGIGKSTLAALMAGLLTPQSGAVRIGEAPVLLPQEAYVFTGTVGENLRYLAPDAEPARVEAAVDALGARPLVGRLGGYHAPLDPAALSAGERQLIALVRAYLAPARLAILDEATCHLDAATEARAERAFAGRPGALVVIAHRMTSARRARRILLFDGAGPALGDHAQLLAGSAAYRELVGCWTEAGGDGGPSDPAGLLGEVDGLDAVAGAGLRDDSGEMVANGAGRDRQLAGDVLDRQALRRDLQHP